MPDCRRSFVPTRCQASASEALNFARVCFSERRRRLLRPQEPPTRVAGGRAVRFHLAEPPCATLSALYPTLIAPAFPRQALTHVPCAYIPCPALPCPGCRLPCFACKGPPQGLRQHRRNPRRARSTPPVRAFRP